ncbi:LysR family transcriptional regulator [Bradyrhizobium sp. STM 3809]|uniref:LysR family transcriptional regulator n=1 Tax=Bradyrhizobium sp. STM 3809 TaxID=551936 RepID=UPI0002408D9D|nr:LysR family transcriptional regulator [Bradyrhizobium sp. STM 3809]CCE00525.1 putative transcriptional regulatory protein, LysR family [Bradyrhizobium sp. STM 3809]
MIQLTDVRVFLEVVSAGSFTTAARTLKIPKSSVARQIARLEDDIGVMLLARTTRTLELTDQGRTFLPYARRLLDDGIEASNVIRSHREGASGLLTVTASSTFGRMFLAPHLSTFRKQHPNIRVDLKLTATKLVIGVSQADIAIRLGPIVDPNLGVQSFGRMEFCLVAAPAYMKGRPSVTKPLDLAGHELIELRPPASDNQLELHKDGKLQCVRCVPAMVIDDPDTAKVVCLMAGGIATVPTFLVANEIRDATLVRILPDWSLAPAPISVVYAKQIAPSLRVRAYLEFLASTIGKTRPWEVELKPPKVKRSSS